jgi:hypothetical protein
MQMEIKKRHASEKVKSGKFGMMGNNENKGEQKHNKDVKEEWTMEKKSVKLIGGDYNNITRIDDTKLVYISRKCDEKNFRKILGE